MSKGLWSYKMGDGWRRTINSAQCIIRATNAEPPLELCIYIETKPIITSKHDTFFDANAAAERGAA